MSRSQAGLQLATDSGGNVTGIVGFGKTFNPRCLSVPNGVMLVGDSLVGQTFNPITTTAVTDNGNGTVSVTLTNPVYGSNVHLAVGDVIQIYNSTFLPANQNAAKILSIDPVANTITYATSGAYTKLTGAKAVITQMSSLQNGASNIFQSLNRLCGGQLDIVSNCTIPGGAVEDVSGVFDTNAVTCRFAIGLFGTNNIYGIGDSFIQLRDKAKALIDKIMARCEYFIMVTPPPPKGGKLNSGDAAETVYGNWSAARAAIQNQYEHWLQWYVTSKGGRVVVSRLASTGNPGNVVTVGNQQSTKGDPTYVPLMVSTDNLHMNMLSSFAIGKAVYNKIKGLIVPWFPWPASVLDVPASNPTFVSDTVLLSGTGGTFTGAVTGTIPDGVTIAATLASVTASVAARTMAADGDTVGNNLILGITNTSGDASVSLTFYTPNTRFVTKDIICAAVRLVNFTAVTGLTGINVRFDGFSTQVINGTTYNPRTILDSGSGSVSTVSLLEDMTNCVERTPFFQIRDPAITGNSETLVSATFTLSLKFTGSVNTTLTIAHPSVRRFTI